MRRPVAPPGSTIVGLDLSLRAAAACALPHRWKHDLKKAQVMTIGVKLEASATPLDRLQRLIDISDGIVDFCEENNASHVFVEEYAFAAMLSHAHALGECGGGVKLEMYRRLKIVVAPIVASSARKTLLQHVPSPRGKPKGFVKNFVEYNVRRIAKVAQKWTPDEVDAFVITNHGIMLTGGVPLSFIGE